MNSARAILTPPPIATEAFTDAAAAVARLDEIYQRNTQFLRDRFEAYVNGEPLSARVRANYPFVRLTTSTYVRLDSRLAYGFVARPGVYETTVTRPDLFRAYLTHQIRRLVENHGVPVEIGESKEAIPIHFAYRRDINIEATLTPGDKSGAVRSLRDYFDVPDLATMDDAIAAALGVPRSDGQGLRRSGRHQHHGFTQRALLRHHGRFQPAGFFTRTGAVRDGAP